MVKLIKIRRILSLILLILLVLSTIAGIGLMKSPREKVAKEINWIYNTLFCTYISQ